MAFTLDGGTVVYVIDIGNPVTLALVNINEQVSNVMPQ